MGIAPGSYSFMGGAVLGKGSEGQFVLERDDMSRAFTASEYIQCQSRVSEGSAVCVQWKSGSDRMQAQLSAMLADGAMLFSFTAVDLETIFIVSGSDPHNITVHTNSLGGDGPVYVQETHTSSDSNVTVTSQKTTCTFDSNLNDFTGELHVRFQNSGQAATVAFYVNNEYYDKVVSTLSVMTGVTHLMVPVSVKSGSLRVEVTFATASTPSNVKFDLAGYNLGTGGGGQSLSVSLPLKIEAGKITNNGTNLTCTGDNAWAEGKSNEATGDYSHAEGQLCKAKGQASHAGGQSCETSGQNSFAHGAYLKTSSQSLYPTAAFGMYNSDQKAMFVIGNGTAENNRKDAFKVDQSGHLWCMVNGTLTDVSALLASL